MKHYTFYAALVLAALVLPLGAFAKNTPVPGGANQMNGVETTFPATIFNGFVRIKPKYFGPARPQDNVIETPSDGRVVLVFDGVISDGSTKPYMDDPSILLADADGITADTRSIEPNGIILQQATAAKLHVVFWAPKDFVPDHLLYACQATKCKAMRIKFKH
jgi:hypothetical protein